MIKVQKVLKDYSKKNRNCDCCNTLLDDEYYQIQVGDNNHKVWLMRLCDSCIEDFHKLLAKDARDREKAQAL